MISRVLLHASFESDPTFWFSIKEQIKEWWTVTLLSLVRRESIGIWCTLFSTSNFETQDYVFEKSLWLNFSWNVPYSTWALHQMIYVLFTLPWKKTAVRPFLHWCFIIYTLPRTTIARKGPVWIGYIIIFEQVNHPSISWPAFGTAWQSAIPADWPAVLLMALAFSKAFVYERWPSSSSKQLKKPTP